MIEAGAAGVHFEDQLAAEKKCGHLGGKVLVPTSQFVRTLVAARLAADVLDVPDGARRAHRRAQRLAAHERHRPARRAVPHRRAHRRGLLPRARRARGGDRPRRSPTRRTRTCSGSRPRRRTSARRASSPPRSTSSSRASCSPTTARRRSTGSATSTRREIARFQRDARRARLPLPVHHARRLPLAQRGDVRAGARLRRAAGCPPTSSCRSASSRSRTTATPRRATSARSAPATSTGSPRS